MKPPVSAPRHIKTLVLVTVFGSACADYIVVDDRGGMSLHGKPPAGTGGEPIDDLEEVLRSRDEDMFTAVCA